MNREIKFRAWDGKRMTTSGISFNNSNSCLETPIGAQMKLMQFTGLKDKNDKEIYDGDIVTYYQPYAKRTDTHIVKWDWRFAGFGLFEDKNEWCQESDWLKIQQIEIIGNIYDNPELKTGFY